MDIFFVVSAWQGGGTGRGEAQVGGRHRGAVFRGKGKKRLLICKKGKPELEE